MKHLAPLLLFLCGVATAAPPPTPPTGLISLDPYPAPPLQVSDIDGERYDLAKDRGAVVFVHFWASWCGPCRKEMPAIQRMAALLEPEGLKIVVVNTAEDEDTIFSFLAAYAADIQPFMDADGQITEAWRPRGLPATYLVDQDGLVRYQALGGRPWDTEPYLGFLRELMTDASRRKP